MTNKDHNPKIAKRFRGFLPVVIDVETGGFNPKKDALLEVAAVVIGMDDDGFVFPMETTHCHVEPFPGANMDPAALEFTGIDPYNPFRMAKKENDALGYIFKPIRSALKATGCKRAVLVGHNASFDLGFMNAACTRAGIKRNPFHPFSSFDTATLCGLAYGQTVLARAAQVAGIPWDNDRAHSAAYDTEQTAEIYCRIVNKWREMSGIDMTLEEHDLGS